jgi:hypothetical protein
MINPKYKVDDIVYLRSSAVIGFLETAKISGLHTHQNQWIYTIYAGGATVVPNSTYGDRKSLLDKTTMYFSESEFQTLCEALPMVRANLQDRLNKIDAAIQINGCEPGTT